MDGLIEKRYGIIVNHGDGTRRVFGTITRSDKGDVYVNWDIPEEFPSVTVKPWKPHASYHASGQMHAKSHDRILLKRHLQRPTESFAGTEPIEYANASRGLSTKLRIVAEVFDDTFEIDVALISGTTSQAVAVDLIEPGATPIRVCSDKDVLNASKVFADRIPWISVRLVEPAVSPPAIAGS